MKLLFLIFSSLSLVSHIELVVLFLFFINNGISYKLLYINYYTLKLSSPI